MKIWTASMTTTGVLLAAAFCAAPAHALATTSHVGALEYIEGKAFVNNQAVEGNKDQLPILDNGQSLRTGKGHAEMILTPGTFLRLDAGSEVNLVNASLTDTRVRLNRGAALLEVDDLHKDNRLRVQVGDKTVRVLKTGLYRFDAQPARVEVLSGKVETRQGDRQLKAGKHREFLFSPEAQVVKFKNQPDDDLSRWSRLRSEYEAAASVASAQYVYDMGMPWGFSDWFWNPWFDSWTFLPADGFCLNPYGFGYMSPWMVYNYYPIRYYGYRHYAFTPRAGVVSPSGLNLQRGPELRAANNGMVRNRGMLPYRGMMPGTRMSPGFGHRGLPSAGGRVGMVHPMGGGFARRR